MVDGKGPLPDSRREIVFIGVIGLAIVGAFAYSTTLDAQVGHLATSPGSYFSVADSGTQGVTFTDTQIDRMRWASITSVGSSAFGDERLFCGSITETGKVESIRLADDIRLSEFDSVSGACISRFPSQDINFFVHSQPGSEQLSSQDKKLETPVPFTCAIGFEMSVSPVSKRVDGISCYEVVGEGESFERVPVYAN